jgi:hypothetical protein
MWAPDPDQPARARAHGPNCGVADSLDEAKAAFRRAWDAKGQPGSNAPRRARHGRVAPQITSSGVHDPATATRR